MTSHPVPKSIRHDASIVGQHHVVRFDVAVQETRLVHRRDCVTELDADFHGFGNAETFPLFEHLFEGLPLDQLHRKTDLIVDLLGAVDGDDVRMANPRQ